MTALHTLLLGLFMAMASQNSAEAPASVARSADEAAVLAADARQRDAVAAADGVAIDAVSHANLRINAPSNRILTRDDLIRDGGVGRDPQ